jgi:hypothetical protein
MKTKRTKHQRLPGLSSAESAQLYHAIGKIDDLERPNIYVCALLLECRGIVRALKRRAKNRKATFDHIINALESIDCTMIELRESGVS